MGALATQVTREEYLSTSYDPDREWVDGELVERNVGTQLHSLLQTMIAGYFLGFRSSHRVQVLVEARLGVGDRTRIPDVMVLQTPYTRSKVTVDVPLVVVEVKSPDDRFDDVMEKCFEYSKLGVAYILVFDPDHRRMYRFTADGNLTRTLEEQIVVETGEIPIVAERLFDMLAGE